MLRECLSTITTTDITLKDFSNNTDLTLHRLSEGKNANPAWSFPNLGLYDHTLVTALHSVRDH